MRFGFIFLLAVIFGCSSAPTVHENEPPKAAKVSAPAPTRAEKTKTPTPVTTLSFREIVQSHEPEVQECYASALKKTPAIKGRLTVQWDVIDGGKVADAHVLRNSTGSTDLAQCIVGRLRTWTFAPPIVEGGRTTVTYPFVFTYERSGYKETITTEPVER